MQKKFVQGFKINRHKVALVAEVESQRDPQVDNFIHVIISRMNREGYKYIAAAYDHDPSPTEPDDYLSLVIVLADSHDEAELKKRDVGQIEESIEYARPHVLDGPGVWELWG